MGTCHILQINPIQTASLEVLQTGGLQDVLVNGTASYEIIVTIELEG